VNAILFNLFYLVALDYYMLTYSLFSFDSTTIPTVYCTHDHVGLTVTVHSELSKNIQYSKPKLRKSVQALVHCFDLAYTRLRSE